jgi:hypothetical protein
VEVAVADAPREVEVERPVALPRPEVGVEVRGAPLMAALVVFPAAVSAGQSPARRLALAEAVARAVPAAVVLVVLTIVHGGVAAAPALGVGCPDGVVACPG